MSLDLSQKNTRRKVIGGAATAVIAATAPEARAQTNSKKVVRIGPKPATVPPFSPGIQYGSLLFLSGVNYREPGDIKVAVTAVLSDIKKQLEAAGSSMTKVLKCTVFLADIGDFDAMNAVYTGQFGAEPPARTTVAVAALPGNSRVEIEVVAYV